MDPLAAGPSGSERLQAASPGRCRSLTARAALRTVGRTGTDKTVATATGGQRPQTAATVAGLVGGRSIALGLQGSEAETAPPAPSAAVALACRSGSVSGTSRAWAPSSRNLVEHVARSRIRHRAVVGAGSSRSGGSLGGAGGGVDSARANVRSGHCARVARLFMCFHGCGQVCRFVMLSMIFHGCECLCATIPQVPQALALFPPRMLHAWRTM